MEHVLYEMSWQNLLLYTAATPQYDDKTEEGENGYKDSLDACNTSLFADEPEEEYVKSF